MGLGGKICNITSNVFPSSPTIDSLQDDTVRDWSQYVLPSVRQITGFLLIYSVQSLKSVGDLLPNLAVIRGLELLQGFALVVNHCIKMQVKLAALSRIGDVTTNKTIGPHTDFLIMCPCFIIVFYSKL